MFYYQTLLPASYHGQTTHHQVILPELNRIGVEIFKKMSHPVLDGLLLIPDLVSRLDSRGFSREPSSHDKESSGWN